MSKALHAGAYLAVAMLGLCLVMLVVGLGMAARPEFLAGLGFYSTARLGLALALVAGVGAVASAVLLRVLDVLGSGLDGET